MNRIGRVLTLALMLSSAHPSVVAADYDNGVGRGTLGMLIVTRRGMVLAADSRTTYSDGHHDDRAVKVFRLGKHSGCMIAGIVVTPTTAEGRGFNLPQEIGKLSQTPGIHDDPLVFEAVLIAGYGVVTGSAEAKIPDRYMDEAYKIKYLWGRHANIKGGSRMKTFNNAYAVRLRQYHVLEVDGTGPFAIFTNGADVVSRAILRGNENSSFFSPLTQRVVEVNLRETKRQTALRTFYKLRGADELDSMSLKQAVELADALIAENIRLAGDDLGIGGQVVIATITRDRGFQWVEGHDPFVRVK